MDDGITGYSIPFPQTFRDFHNVIGVGQSSHYNNYTLVIFINLELDLEVDPPLGRTKLL